MNKSISESKTGKEIYIAPEIETINLVAESAFLQGSGDGEISGEGEGGWD